LFVFVHFVTWLIVCFCALCYLADVIHKLSLH